MRVVPYDKKYKNDFIEINTAWIREMFVFEEMDEYELSHIEDYLERGGEIFFTLDDNDMVLSCAMIAPRLDGVWEFMKFGSRKRSKGAGWLCLDACMEYVKKRGVDRVIIISNTKCEAALHMYEKVGFKEIAIPKDMRSFDRCNIMLEKYF